MSLARLAIVLSLLLGLNGPVLAKRCDFLAEAPQPGWVTGDQGLEGHYTGVGQAGYQDSVKRQLEIAKQSAIKDLASNIEVSVRNDLTVSETLQSGPSGPISETQIESITKSTTEVSLANVQVDATWLNRKRCIVWIRVAVSVPEVKAQQARQYRQAKVARLDEAIARADDGAQKQGERERALELAQALLGEIDFARLEGGLSRDFYAQAIERIRKRVQSAGQQAGDVAETLEQARNLILQAAQEGAATVRARLLSQAKQILSRLSRIRAFGVAPDFWAEQASWELAELNRQQSNPCGARLELERIVQQSSDKNWSQRARRAMRLLDCSEQDQRRQVWRQRFANRQVSVVCALRTGDDSAFWPRVCDDVSGFLSSHGAVVSVALEQQPDTVLAMAAGRGSQRPPGGDLVVLLAADGKINTRAQQDAANAMDYQFQGQLLSRVISGGEEEYSDRYRGISGWNPVSREMAMDVVALQISRRWQERYYRQMVGREQ